MLASPIPCVKHDQQASALQKHFLPRSLKHMFCPQHSMASMATIWMFSLLLSTTLVFAHNEEMSQGSIDLASRPEEWLPSSEFERAAETYIAHKASYVQRESEVDKAHKVLMKIVSRQLDACKEAQSTNRQGKECILAKKVDEVLNPVVAAADAITVSRQAVTVGSHDFKLYCSDYCAKLIYQNCHWGEWFNYRARQCWKSGP